MNILKNNALLPLASLVATLMSAPTTLTAGEVDQTLDWVSGGEINVNITAGKIQFRGWGKDEVKLTGDFNGEDERLVFKQSGKDIKLEIKDESRGWWGGHSGGNVDFTVFAPFDSDLDIDGTSLRIGIKDIKGNVDANSISGSLRLSGPSKRVDIETVSGDVDIEDASGKMRIRTVSGDINADVDAYTFDAKTVSGDIDGKIGRNEYANLLSVSGDIEVELTLINDGRVEGQTVSGNIELTFDDTVNADFELNTGPGGDIYNRLSTEKPSDTSRWGQELRFTKGDGDGTVELETMSGTLKVR